MKGDEQKTEAHAPLRKLGELAETRPRTKTGQVLWAWPQICAALERGWRLGDVYIALCEDGVDMPYNQFRVYVSRIRRRGSRLLQATVSANAAPHWVGDSGPKPEPRHPPQLELPASGRTPYEAIKRQRERKRKSGFEYDPFSTDKDLLE